MDNFWWTGISEEKNYKFDSYMEDPLKNGFV